MLRRLNQIGFALVTVLAVWLLYRFTKSQVEAGLYKDKLTTLRADYETLRTDFNSAVKKTAVTELMVEKDGSVHVVFVNLDGSECTVATPFKMGSEIYVDFIAVDNRLMLRRVFDENTRPKEALVIDPQLQKVDWQSGKVQRGSAIYAQLNKEGRWVVSVTGNGSLEIVWRDAKDERKPLVAAPPVKEFPLIEKELDAKFDEIGVGDVFEALFGTSKK